MAEKLCRLLGAVGAVWMLGVCGASDADSISVLSTAIQLGCALSLLSAGIFGVKKIKHAKKAHTDRLRRSMQTAA